MSEDGADCADNVPEDFSERAQPALEAALGVDDDRHSTDGEELQIDAQLAKSASECHLALEAALSVDDVANVPDEEYAVPDDLRLKAEMALEANKAMSAALGAASQAPVALPGVAAQRAELQEEILSARRCEASLSRYPLQTPVLEPNVRARLLANVVHSPHPSEHELRHESVWLGNSIACSSCEAPDAECQSELRALRERCAQLERENFELREQLVNSAPAKDPKHEEVVEDHARGMREPDYYDLCDKYFLKWRGVCLQNRPGSPLIVGVSSQDRRSCPHQGSEAPQGEAEDVFAVGDLVAAEFGAGTTLKGNDFVESLLRGEITRVDMESVVCRPHGIAEQTCYEIRWVDGSKSQRVRRDGKIWQTSIEGNTILRLAKNFDSPDPDSLPLCKIAVAATGENEAEVCRRLAGISDNSALTEDPHKRSSALSVDAVVIQPSPSTLEFETLEREVAEEHCDDQQDFWILTDDEDDDSHQTPRTLTKLMSSTLLPLQEDETEAEGEDAGDVQASFENADGDQKPSLSREQNSQKSCSTEEGSCLSTQKSDDAIFPVASPALTWRGMPTSVETDSEDDVEEPESELEAQHEREAEPDPMQAQSTQSSSAVASAVDIETSEKRAALEISSSSSCEARSGQQQGGKQSDLVAAPVVLWQSSQPRQCTHQAKFAQVQPGNLQQLVQHPRQPVACSVETTSQHKVGAPEAATARFQPIAPAAPWTVTAQHGPLVTRRMSAELPSQTQRRWSSPPQLNRPEFTAAHGSASYADQHRSSSPPQLMGPPATTLLSARAPGGPTLLSAQSSFYGTAVAPAWCGQQCPRQCTGSYTAPPVLSPPTAQRRQSVA